MKRILAIFLAVALVFSISACGTNTSENPAESEKTPAEEKEPEDQEISEISTDELLSDSPDTYDYALRVSINPEFILFKTEMGVNFQEYVQSVRMKESCRLLINTSKKVSEIAAAVGYTDIKFFNEMFKRQIGMTPREFRGKYRT